MPEKGGHYFVYGYNDETKETNKSNRSIIT